MPTHVYFSGGQSITIEEDFDQVQQQLEHEAGLLTLRTGAEAGGNRVSIHRAAVAYIEEIPAPSAAPPRRGTAAARRRAGSAGSTSGGMRVEGNQD
jgi:hypothetical protein